MKIRRSALALALALPCSGASASELKASPEAEQEFWAFTERIADALSGDAHDLTKLMSRPGGHPSPSTVSGKKALSTEIGPSLFAEEVKVEVGENQRADSVSFRLSGSCVSLASVRARYPRLLVLAHGASEREWNTFGTQVGDSVIAFWFQGTHFGCMRRVDITPAAGIVSRLNLD